MFKKLKHNKNYKLIIGLIIGFFVSSTVVSALYLGTASELSYDPSNTWLTSTTVQGALDELYYRKDCTSENICIDTSTAILPGDYVRYIPSKTSYTTDKTKTGYSSTQTINPSELTLWRVLSINQDGTIDIISDSVSSIDIYFNSQIGFQNLVGYLNVLASQYQNNGVTVGSRHFGYNGQTEYITNTTYFTNSVPWTCSTGEVCNPLPDDNEADGGGDMNFFKDYNLLYDALKTRIAKRVNTSKAASYWMASRYYYSSGGANLDYGWGGRYITLNGILGYNSLYYFDGAAWGSNASYSALRPIVTLKSGLTYSGNGTEEHPMEIQ